MSARRKTSGLERTAYHEAGHAVMAVAFGARLKAVSIIPAEGRCSVTRKQPITTLWGGLVAEELLTGRSPYRAWAQWDWKVLRDMARGREAVDGVMIAYLVTRRILRRNWPAVRALAGILLRERSISGRHARNLLQVEEAP